MKIYSLMLLLPLGLMSSQAMAFYQKPGALADMAGDAGLRAGGQQNPFALAYDKTSVPLHLSAGNAAFPIAGCHCPFCTMLRQAALVTG